MPTIVRRTLLAGLLSLAACSGTPKPAVQAPLRIAVIPKGTTTIPSPMPRLPPVTMTARP